MVIDSRERFDARLVLMFDSVCVYGVMDGMVEDLNLNES